LGFDLNCHGWLAFFADRDLLVVSLDGCSVIEMLVKPRIKRGRGDYQREGDG